MSHLNAGEETLTRALKFKKRDFKLCGKEREVSSLIEASKIQSGLETIKPGLIAKLAGVRRELVYRVQAKLVARDKYEPKKESTQYKL